MSISLLIVASFPLFLCPFTIIFAKHFTCIDHFLPLYLQVLPGSMHNMVWKGEEGGDSDDEYSRSTSRMGDDDDDYSSGDSDDDSEVCVLLTKRVCDLWWWICCCDYMM